MIERERSLQNSLGIWLTSLTTGFDNRGVRAHGRHSGSSAIPLAEAVYIFVSYPMCEPQRVVSRNSARGRGGRGKRPPENP